MAAKRSSAGTKVYKHHKNDRCFVCRERFEVHGSAKDKKGQVCKDFEYIPPTARDQRDVLFSAPFQSESSGNIWVVKAWRQGDYSCNCTGWRNWRTCDHCTRVAANPEKYKGKQADAINAGAGSVLGTIEELKNKMAQAEAAARRGDAVELHKLEAEIEMQRSIMGAAADTLGDQFDRTKTNIMNHVYGIEPKTAQDVQPSTQASVPATVVNPDDPFGEM